jgi:excisionase family DNA binding protein
MNAMLAPVLHDEETLTLPEAARELGIAHVTLWRMVKAGRVATVKLGPVYGITRTELERFRRVHRPIGRPRKQPPSP